MSFLCLRLLSHPAPQHHTSFCSWLSAQALRWFFPPSPQESCFWNVASQMASQGYPCANQRTPFLLLCLCCPLLFAQSKPLLPRAPQAQFSQTFFISSNPWVCPGVRTNHPSTQSRSVLAPQSRGFITELDVPVLLLWLGKRWRQVPSEGQRVNTGKHSSH